MSKPNIVFVFADDWGWGDLGCYGHQIIQTPNLDFLASQGRLLTQFYVCSGVCSPSRAAVITGQFPGRFGIHGHFATHEQNAARGMPNWLDPGHQTYMKLLGRAGYAIGHYGKWHLGNGEGAPEPSEYGVHEYRVNAGPGPQLPFSVVTPMDEGRWPFGKHAGSVARAQTGHEHDRSASNLDDPHEWRSGPRAKSSVIIVNEAIDFIDRHQDQPFLVNVWLNDTHATLDPDPDQLERYEHLMPDGVADKHVGANAIYSAVVTEADKQIGRLVRHLDETGLRDNTIVIFSADNGPEDIGIRNSSHSGVGSPGPFRGRKRSLYEGGVRVPFILSWPSGAGEQGVVDNESPLCAVDLLPTFCSLAGVEVPDEVKLDGEDMSDVFTGTSRGRTTPLYWEWRFRVWGHTLNKSPMLAMREGPWKLLFNPEGDRTELYYVPDDLLEVNNVAASHPEIVASMSASALAWQTELPEGPMDDDAGSNAYPWPGGER